MIDILMRRRQNNPILTGEAGVGKTAVVEALALRLAAGDVPPGLKDVQLILSRKWKYKYKSHNEKADFSANYIFLHFSSPPL